MRKAAGLARKANRRKQQQQQKEQHPTQSNSSNSPSNSKENSPATVKKHTPDEAALTAKNYRLAKELVSLISYSRDTNFRIARL